MESLEQAEDRARSFGCVVTWAVGQHLVQVVPTRDGMSRNTSITYRIGGWDVDRTKVLALLAGQAPQPRETYQQMLESRVGGGLKISGVGRA